MNTVDQCPLCASAPGIAPDLSMLRELTYYLALAELLAEHCSDDVVAQAETQAALARNLLGTA